MKQKIDLTSSYIRTNGIKLANAIYKIAEDVDFNGQQIQMPANCVLSFEGGSIANAKISGGNIAVFQSLNRGTVEKAYVKVDGGKYL